MKKSIYIITIILSLIFMSKINASCDEKAESDAFKLTATYEIHQIKDINDDTPPVQIIINNITENIYIKVFETLKDSTTEYYYKDTKNGKLTIDFYYIYKSIDYQIKVYSVKNDCADILKEINISTPIYNKYSEYKICQDSKNYKYCKTFVDTDLNEKELEEKILEYNKIKKEGFIGLSIDFIKNNYLFILIPILIVSAYFIIRLIILKRSRKQ